MISFQSKGLPRQPSNQKNKSQGGPGPRQINVSISKDIELHRAKEAWKPAAKDSKKPEAGKDAEDPDVGSTLLAHMRRHQRKGTLLRKKQSS